MKTVSTKIVTLIAIIAMTAFFSPGLNAQDDSQSLSIRENSLFTDGVNLPASPQAWAMNRYGNESIDLYTGTVGVSLPVYTYSDDDFTIPVSINYSSDGYRPNIQSGPLGLGWNLSLGGAITREVRGIPDDTPATSDSYHFQDKFVGYSMNSSSYGPSPEVYGFAYYHLEYDSDSFSYNDNLVRSGKLGEEYMFVKDCWRKVQDGSSIPTAKCYEQMPDIFRFTAPGLSGRFILQPGGEVIFYDTADSPYGYSLSFEMNGGGFTEFTITTPDRYVYTYAQMDLCTSISQLSDTNDNITTPGSWRLSRIEAPNGRYVSFVYGARNIAQSSQHVRCLDWANLVPRDTAPDESGVDTAFTSGGDGVSWSETRSDCLTQVKICSADGSSVCTIAMDYVSGILEYGASATDCKKLSSVTVRNGSGRVIRHCTLSYDIVRDPVVSSNGVTFLKSVSIDGEGTTSFSYYGNGSNAIDASTEFPHMTTLSVDWYGYYNPSVTSQSFAPSMQAARNSTSDTWLLTMRQPDLCSTRLGMLRSISYPTGGEASYEYELNTYSLDLTGLDNSYIGTASGLRVKSVSLRDRDGSLLQKRSFHYGDSLRSSGTLLRRPVIYTYYRLESSGYSCIEHRALSTNSDLFYGVSPHIEYTAVTEIVTGEGGADTCEIGYSFSTGADGVLGNSYGSASSEYDSMTPVFFCRHRDNELRNYYLFNTIRTVQDYHGGGKLLSRIEYTRDDSGTRRPVRSESYTYSPFQNSIPVDYTAKTFCLSLSTEYTYRFNTPRMTEYDLTEYTLDGSPLQSRSKNYTYDGLQRPVRVSTRDSEGKELSTRYVWDRSHPWLLLQKCSYRDELMMSGMKYAWCRPDASEHPDWWAPRSLSRAAITLVHFEDEGSEPWDETSDSWQEVASFREFNAAGKPTVVRDAMNHETHYSWDSSGLNLTSMTQYPDGTASPGLTTRWDWIPLVGITKVTRPGGKVERYGYDSCGRLVSVADSDGDTLARYDYHIATGVNDKNWTRVRSYISPNQFADDITFYNGLGYPEQSNSVGAGGGNYDIITPYTYDALLRPEREWLPVPCETSGGEPDVDVSDIYFGDLTHWQLSWYQDWYGPVTECDEETVLARPFLKTISEFCPSGRPLSHTMAGPGYGEHPTSFSYLADTIDCRAVRGVRTTDGDGRVSIEWKDCEDRIVALDRYQYDSLSVACGDTLARTLYRYDWRGNLTQVITPEENSYHYTYDALSRVISKTIPGREPETYTYDALDRMVTSQDGNQRINGISIEYTYDNIGRFTGRYANLENEETDENRPMASYTYSPATGLKTSERIYMLSADGWVSGADYITRSFTYDREERVSRVVESDSDGDYTLTTDFTYDLAGNVLTRTETCEQGNGDQVTVLTTRSYDSRSRIIGEAVSVNGVQKSSVSIAYDELGRPCRTTYGSGSDAITESTTYTIQGWTESKWSDLLRQSWHYENSSLPSWTGNITRWDWRHLAAAGESDSSGNAASYQQRSELFSYDGLNRLSGSAMTVGTGATATSDSRWSERNIRYDLDGNILHLERYQEAASAPQATLDFSYDGPKRNGYSYDSNGNITCDPLRCFEIRYNLLNLSADVIGHDTEDTAAEGTLLCETVYYADGTRAGVKTPDDGYWTTRYFGSLIYEGEPGQETLEGVITDYGFIQWNGSAASSRMQYFLRDHLGSVRVIAENRHTVIIRTDYLPFGVRMSGDGLTGVNSTARSSFFGFSGKENEMWGGYDTADGDITPHWLKGERYQHFGARAYDPVSCIFMQVDPMAEKYYGMTPYHYCAGNPVMMVDPDGKFPETLWDFANVVLDVTSLVSNIKQGNSSAAIADAAGLVLDVAATIIPFIPGGAGTALKAARGVDKAADVVRAADKATDASVIPPKVSASNGVLNELIEEGGKKLNSTGSYTITFESGMKYHGKGPESRMQQSAREKSKVYSDPVVAKDWTPSPTEKDAFIDEAKRIRNDGGVKNISNYNKINSPGEKYLK